MKQLNRRVSASEHKITALRSQKSYSRRLKRTAGLLARRARDLKVLNRDRTDLDKAFIDLKAKVDQRQLAVRKLDSEYVLVRDEVKKSDQRLKGMVAQRKGLARELRSKRSARQSQIVGMKNEEKAVLARSVEMERSIRKLDREGQKLKGRLASARKSLTEKNNLLRGIERRLVPAEKQRKALAAQLKAEQGRVGAADAQVAQMSAQLSRHQKHLKEMSSGR